MSLTTVQVCQSNEPYHTMLVGSASNPGTFYDILVPFPEDGPEDWICSCIGWQFRGYCSHLSKVVPCHWQELVGPEKQEEHQQHAHICPRCWGPTQDELQMT